MQVLIVSQCTKNALAETRRVIDQFAERCGARTWKTHITQQGLDTLRRLLKSTARRNTAVACHWVRSRDYMELVWIVGKAGRFNERGSVPTDTTEKDVLRQADENDWHTLESIKTLAAIASLFHDFGKSCESFQKKLLARDRLADAYRHEWISLRLFEAFVNNAKDDRQWLTALAELEHSKAAAVIKHCFAVLIKDGIDETAAATSPFSTLPRLARAVGWLIVTHHFLLKAPDVNQVGANKLINLLDNIGPEWNSGKAQMYTKKSEEACWQFSVEHPLPFASKKWCESASYWGIRALKNNQLLQNDWLQDGFSLHLARLSLMLADHHYSSQPSQAKFGDANFSLYANTERNKDTDEIKLKQRLDEHLIGVAKYAKNITRSLPALAKVLPRIAQQKGFKKRTTVSRFSWQNDAYDLAYSLRELTEAQGFFGINMASTGCGKTLANGRIMYGLANPVRGARFSIALGLRVLTLQTGKVYQEMLKLEDDDLAILVGSSAVKELFAIQAEREKAINEQQKIVQDSGSESAMPLMLDDGYVHYEGSLEVGPLQKWLAVNSQERKLISAPILVCTIDHLISATEGTRGGRQIAPMLRLLTSDLILDEPDDFDIADLPALSRLVHWAGMLGSRVLLSSATLPPALVQGLFDAYLAGRRLFQQSRGTAGLAVNICCAWFDEYNTMASQQASIADFKAAHEQFIAKRLLKLKKAEAQRRAVIKPINNIANVSAEIRQNLAPLLSNMLHELHQQHNTSDPATGKRISFGLIRFAHIDPLIDACRALYSLDAQANHQLYLCCYHSRHPLLIRTAIEEQLDNFLDRKPPKSLFEKARMQQYLTATTSENIIFVVLASPVAEVGRDHDYDWAIVEPSSMRSIIQLAGRVRRHRFEPCSTPNIYLLNTNIKSLENAGKKATFCRPGFESEKDNGRFLLTSHQLENILRPEEYEIITAATRITAHEELYEKNSLVDLEHARLQDLMLPQSSMQHFSASWWWNDSSQIILSDFMQQKTRFRFDHRTRSRYAYTLYENDELSFFKEGKPWQESDQRFKCSCKNFIRLQRGHNVDVWGEYDYRKLLLDLAEQQNLTPFTSGLRFGYVELEDESNWCYNPFFGIRRSCF